MDKHEFAKPSSNRINKNRSRSLFQPPQPDKRSTSVFLYRVLVFTSSLHGHASMRKEIGSWFERDMENSFSIKVELEGRWWLISTFAPIFTTLFHSSVCIYRCCRFNTTWSHLLFRIAGWMIFAEEMAWNYRFVGFQNISSWNFWTAMEIAWFLIRLFALKICNSFVEEVCWFLYL